MSLMPYETFETRWKSSEISWNAYEKSLGPSNTPEITSVTHLKPAGNSLKLHKIPWKPLEAHCNPSEISWNALICLEMPLIRPLPEMPLNALRSPLEFQNQDFTTFSQGLIQKPFEKFFQKFFKKFQASRYYCRNPFENCFENFLKITWN